MKYKYECPSGGVKEVTSLWKAAAQSFRSVLKEGLANIASFGGQLSDEMLIELYSVMANILGSFLLSKRYVNLSCVLTYLY